MTKNVKNEFPGIFITLDGLDGSGLSTQVNLLNTFFRKNSVESYSTKEPTNNIIGGLIRGALTGVHQLPPESLQLLFSADRLHHLDREIIPLLKEGNVVICDRYFWSTVAFGSLDANRDWLLEINKYSPQPDVSIALKVPPETCIERIFENRYDLELFEKKEKLEKVWDTYEWLARKKGMSLKIVDGTGTVEEVHAKIVDQILSNQKAQKVFKSDRIKILVPHF